MIKRCKSDNLWIYLSITESSFAILGQTGSGDDGSWVFANAFLDKATYCVDKNKIAN